MIKKLISKILLGSMLMPSLMLGNTATYAMRSEPQTIAKTKLELPFLMNVALFFENDKDLHSLMQVNRKGKFSVLQLKLRTEKLNKEIELTPGFIDALHENYPSVQTIEINVNRIGELSGETLLKCGITRIKSYSDDNNISRNVSLDFLEELKKIKEKFDLIINNDGETLTLELPKCLTVAELYDGKTLLISKSRSLYEKLSLISSDFIKANSSIFDGITCIVSKTSLSKNPYDVDVYVENLKNLFPNLKVIADNCIFVSIFNHDLNETPGEAHYLNAGKSIQEINVSGVKVFLGIDNSENKETA